MCEESRESVSCRNCLVRSGFILCVCEQVETELVKNPSF